MPHVLVVEDHVDTCTAMLLLLKHSGYDARCAYDGAAGLEAIEAAKPDLVLLDVMMPGMTGLEVLARLRKDERYRELPVVMYSAASEYRQIALALGAQDFLLKSGMKWAAMLDVVRLYAGAA